MIRPMRILLLVLAGFAFPAAAAEPAFSFHLLGDPTHMDPQTSSSSSGNYVFHSIYRGLYGYHSVKGLHPEGAESCVHSNLRLTCRLSPRHRWSNGRRIKAVDYLNNFYRLMDPRRASPHAETLMRLKNAAKILKGEMPPESLGVTAKDDYTLVFEFEKPDPEFEYKLVQSALSPMPPGGYPLPKNSAKMLTSGPYVIAEWKPGDFVRLKANPYYQTSKGSRRPPLLAYFIDDDTAALNLYEAGKLSFLRRVTESEVARFKKSSEFHRIAVARFDYLGFGPDLKDRSELRQALTEAFDGPQFLKVFDTVSPPGCPSLPHRLYDPVRCMKFNSEAKKLLTGVRLPERLDFQFSRMGGDDVARISEWFQGQWKKNLGLTVELQSVEQGVYLKRLKVKPPDIFRKGIGLERPTCLAAVELFTTGHPDNYIDLQDAEYDHLVERLADAKTIEERRSRCRTAVEYLSNSRRLIMLGEMYFSILAKKQFTGWDLNELNQLDLSELSARPTSRSLETAK